MRPRFFSPSPFPTADQIMLAAFIPPLFAFIAVLASFETNLFNRCKRRWSSSQLFLLSGSQTEVLVGAPGSVVAERSLVQKERRMAGSTASGWRWHAVDVGLDLDERVVFFFFCFLTGFWFLDLRKRGRAVVVAIAATVGSRCGLLVDFLILHGGFVIVFAVVVSMVSWPLALGGSDAHFSGGLDLGEMRTEGQSGKNEGKNEKNLSL